MKRTDLTSPVILPFLLVMLSSCGGDSGGTTGSLTLVTVTPPPVPPPPPPVATPPPPAPAGPAIAGASVGGVLEGVHACATDPVTRDASGHVTGLNLTNAKIDNFLSLTYRAVDSFSLDVNGFGGPEFDAADKQTWTGGPYDRFLDANNGELFLSRIESPLFAVLGVDNSSGACFFAIGQRPDSLPTQYTEYFTLTDGLARVGTRTTRLYGTDSEMTFDPKTGTAKIKLVLSGRDLPFGDYYNQTSAAIAEVTASLALQPGGYFSTATLAGGQYSGSITGRFVGVGTTNVSGLGGSGAVFTYILRNNTGDILFGVAAAQANLI